MNYQFELIKNDSNLEDQNKVIIDGIINFNAYFIGSKPDRFSIYIKDERNIIIGGFIAYAHPKSIYVDSLWISEEYRRQGLGSKLLSMVEDEAIKRNIKQSTFPMLTE
jgi:ribosomal protein S18 acetylase RimI-like enzyme